MKFILASAITLFLIGCGNDNERYQIAPHANGLVWRLDTKTGDIELCGFEMGGGGQLKCTQFPKELKK